MNGPRMKYVIEAWTLLSFKIRTPRDVEEIQERFERWREKQWSTLHESRWMSSSNERWRIRLKSGRQIDGFLFDPKEHEIQWVPEARLRSTTIDIRRLIKEANLEIMDTPEDRVVPRQKHFDQATYEAQMQVEPQCLGLDEDVADEVKRWIGIKYWDGSPSIRRPNPEERDERNVSGLVTQTEQAGLASQVQRTEKLGPKG
jgi:hypothetical protein